MSKDELSATKFRTNTYTNESPANNTPAYDVLYLLSFEESVTGLFLHTLRVRCNVEESINRFLASDVFNEIHTRANPMYLNKSTKQLWECLTFDENFDPEKTSPDTSNDYEYDILFWTAHVLVRFQHKYNIDFRDWLKYFSMQDVYDMFYPGHEASYEYVIEILKDKYEDAKAQII